MKWRPLMFALLFACIVLLAVLFFVEVRGYASRPAGAFDQLDLLVDVRHQLVKEYVEEPDQKRMVEAGIRGMVESLNDPHTIYIPPEEIEPFDKSIHGSFTGIGVEVDQHDNRPRIVTPLDDSPAWKAGIMAGDIMLEINGKNTEGLTVSQATKLIQGPEGTTVTIKVRRVSGEEAEIAIARGHIIVQTVRGMRRDEQGRWDFMLDPARGIGYIRISQFTETTSNELKQALAQLSERKVKGLVLDFRFNPGGLLDQAVRVSDLFLPGDRRIVSVKGRVVPERITSSTASPDDLIDLPLVVLINEASASASEVVAGALTDNTRARCIGTRSYGKGSVQQVRPLESGQGALKITNAYYYLPNGRNIHRRKDKEVWGVDPDDGCYVAMNAEQVTAMLKIRRENDILRKGAHAGEPVTAEYLEKNLSDQQLAAAYKSLLGKLADGVWPKVGLSGAQALAIETRRAALQRQRDAINERLTVIEKELSRLDPPDTPDTPDAPDAPAATQPKGQ